MSIVLFSLFNNFSAIDVKNALLCFTLGSPKGGREGGRGPIKREGGVKGTGCPPVQGKI